MGYLFSFFRTLSSIFFLGIARVGRAISRVWNCLQVGWRVFWLWFFKLSVIPILFLFISYMLWLSPRDASYRYSYPDHDICKVVQAKYAGVLADNNNDELAAIANSSSLPGKPSSDTLRSSLTCMIQTHTIPRKDNKENLKYNLAFLEFAEAGLPIEFSENKARLSGQTQLQELLAHLRKIQSPAATDKKTNFVISFVHGWRHDASIGDEDIKKLRVFAAYTASFLAQRCETDKSFCKYEVTAVYFGWRGARLDEKWLRRIIGFPGAILDFVFGEVPALLTLFDRKPVSERIGPAIVSALRQIDRVIYDRDVGSEDNWKLRSDSRMVTFGHSLGGNALASALRDDFVQRVNRHTYNATMAPPFGDMIVLLNPASEASNWTTIQRAMRDRIVFDHANRTAKPSDTPPRAAVLPKYIKDKYKLSETDEATLQSQKNDAVEIEKGHWFFPPTQRPIYIALTAANTWPVGGIRRSDCDSYRGNDELKKEARELTHVQYFPKYDFATHDAFPAFKFDFRPLADSLEHYARYRPNTEPLDQYCSDGSRSFIGRVAQGIAAFLRNLPFMNTDPEQTRTIGHLNPMRSTIGAFTNNIRTATFFGTTHELTILDPREPDPIKEKSVSADYLLAGDLEKSECRQNNGWLTEARAKKKNGRGWSHSVTLAFTKQGTSEVALKSQFLHGFVASGMLPVVRANDPFWNVRVFDTGMQYHGDYDSFPLICTIQQLVIDDITDGRR